MKKDNLDDISKQWLDYKEVNESLSPQTIEKYAGYINSLQQFLGDKQIVDADSDDLIEFTGLYCHKKGLSPSSRKAVVSAIKGFYKWALDNEHIINNPAIKVVYPKIGKKLPIAMGLQNAEKLLMQPDISSFTGLRDAAMISLLIGCGMRIGGLCALNQGDLFWYEHNSVTRLAVKLIEKGSKERMVPVPNEAMLLVKAYLGAPELDDMDLSLPNGDKVLFVSTRNRMVPEYDYRGEARRLHKRRVQTVIMKYAEASGIPKNQAHPHALRHLVGAELAEESATAFEIQSILGHSDANTSAIYTQLATRKLTDVLDKANPLGKINTPTTELVKLLKAEAAL